MFLLESFQSTAAQSSHPLSTSRFHIEFSELPQAVGEPIRFSIRIPKHALEGLGLEKLFANVRAVFDPADRCMILNNGDQGVVIEADATVKHKALISLWELGIYNFRFTYRYEAA